MTDDTVSLHSDFGVGTVVSLWGNSGTANISVYLASSFSSSQKKTKENKTSKQQTLPKRFPKPYGTSAVRVPPIPPCRDPRDNSA
jgi:hypothetical protein